MPVGSGIRTVAFLVANYRIGLFAYTYCADPWSSMLEMALEDPTGEIRLP